MKVLTLFVVSDDETCKPVHSMSMVKDYGLDPHNIRIGDILEVEEVLLAVIQIGSSSEKQPHCDIYKRYGMCIMQTEGIFTTVIKGGNVAVGDNMRLKPKNNYAEV